MAVVAPINVDQGFIKTVLTQKDFMDLNSSTLALPPEERLKMGRQDLDKALRIQHQVQMTMARKSKSSSMVNGSAHHSISVPSQAAYSTLSQREVTVRSPPRQYDTMKDYQATSYKNGWSAGGGGGGQSHYRQENGWSSGGGQSHYRQENGWSSGGGQSQYRQENGWVSGGSQSQYRQENGWAGGHTMYSQRLSEKETTPSKPMARREISPEREAGGAATRQRNTSSASLRYPEQRQYTTYRYARSDHGTPAKTRQYTMKSEDSVFLHSGPNSPARPIMEQKHSRSLNNLLERAHYAGASVGAAQVRPVIQQQMSMRPEAYQTGFQHTTQRVTTTTTGRNYAGANGIDVGGKRVTMTAGMAAASGSGHTQTYVDGAVGNSAPPTSEVDMTLERAVSLLQANNSASWQVAAASFIQHECFQKVEARKRVHTLDGIPRLISLLSSDNTEVQRAACAALRNLVFEDYDNKLEVCDQRGMPILLSLLRDTQDLEIKRQITGLLWNLSSNDQLKTLLLREALDTLTRSIIIPGSGWKESEYSKNDIMTDPDIFYNATGCLRNMSSAGPEGRQAMRECNGLIDSLIHYVGKSIADHKPDDRATENCVCILHNLSYQLEGELPSRYSHNFQPAQSRNTPTSDKSIGCFGARSRKIKEWEEAPMAEEIGNPRGVEWLWNSTVVRMYLSLIAKSSRNYTQEASLGSLQNLTAGSGPLPFSVAQLVVQKQSGLQHIRNMLHATDPGVKRTVVSLLRNLCRHNSLHHDIATELMPDLVRVLPESVPESNQANDTAASVCYVLNSLVCSSSQNARLLLQNGGVRKLIGLSSSDGGLGTKAGKAASLVLYNLWAHQELHSAYKKAAFKKGDFVNPKTSKAYNSL